MLSSEEWRRLFWSGRHGLRRRPNGVFALAGPDLRHHDQEFFPDTRHWACAGRAELIPLSSILEPRCRHGVLEHDLARTRVLRPSGAVDQAIRPGQPLPLTEAGGGSDLVHLAAGISLTPRPGAAGEEEVLEAVVTLLAEGRGTVAVLPAKTRRQGDQVMRVRFPGLDGNAASAPPEPSEICPRTPRLLHRSAEEEGRGDRLRAPQLDPVDHPAGMRAVEGAQVEPE